MSRSIQFLALPILLLSSTKPVTADDELTPRMCFFPTERGQISSDALCCDARLQSNEFCGMNSAYWCKDMSAEDIGMGKTVYFYQDDQGVDQITSREAYGNGDVCAAWLWQTFTKPTTPRPSLSQCSLRYDYTPPSPQQPSPPSPPGEAMMLWGRADRATEKCWQPSHVKWMDDEGKVWWGHIAPGKLKQVMERLEQEDCDSLDPFNNQNGGPLVDAACPFTSHGSNVLNGPQEQEQGSGSSSSDQTGSGLELPDSGSSGSGEGSPGLGVPGSDSSGSGDSSSESDGGVAVG